MHAKTPVCMPGNPATARSAVNPFGTLPKALPVVAPPRIVILVAVVSTEAYLRNAGPGGRYGGICGNAVVGRRANLTGRKQSGRIDNAHVREWFTC